MPFLIHNKEDGEEIKLPITLKPIVLGRGVETDIHVEDNEVSRAHCAVWLEGRKILVKDLRSRNGTFVNDGRVQEAELKPGDQVRIGQRSVTVRGNGICVRYHSLSISLQRLFSSVPTDLLHNSYDRQTPAY